jgi:uncharacterized delta-60 repeat protein
MRSLLYALTLVCGLSLFPPLALSTPGDLDTTFNGTGKVITALGSGDNFGETVAIQPDGKILVGGYSSAGSYFIFALIRYNSDGSLDTNFNDAGYVTTEFGTVNDNAESVVIQADGKIVLAGYTHNGSDDDFALVRYTSAGALDATFNGTGKVTTAIGSDHDIAWSVALQSDGKIVAAGYSKNSTDNDIAVVRYDSAGALDTSFNGTGKVTTPIGPGDDNGQSVAIQADGKILVAGNSYNGSKYDVAVVRYDSAGVLDTSFNGSGKVTTTVGTGVDAGQGVAIQSDGKIVVAGYSNSSTKSSFAVLRYNSDGALDTTFNGSGKFTTDIGTGEDAANSVAIQSDGKIVAAGYTHNGSSYDFAAVRLTSDGALDTTFNGTGKVTIPIGSTSNMGLGVALQSDGKIVVAGHSNNGVIDRFATVRLLGAALATLSTTPASSVKAHTAVSGGSISADGGSTITARGVCWNTTGAPTVSDSKTVDGSGTGTFVSSLTNLSPETTYYVRAYATNSSGTAYGSQASFTTTPAVPLGAGAIALFASLLLGLGLARYRVSF